VSDPRDLIYLTARLGERRGMRRGTPATDWYERGCALEGTDPVAAAAAYLRALAGRPDLADAHNNLARILHERGAPGDLAAAEAHYRLAICATPAIALYWFNLGVAVEDRGGAAEAVAHYEHALTLDPALTDAHWNLARLYDQLGRRGNDELVLRRAVRHLVRYRSLAKSPSRGLA
jgi:tetratricopeptide (TPR) repeat protein